MEEYDRDHDHLDEDAVSMLVESLEKVCLDTLQTSQNTGMCFQQLTEIVFTTCFALLESYITTEHELLHFTSYVYELVSDHIAYIRDKIDEKDDDDPLFDVNNN